MSDMDLVVIDGPNLYNVVVAMLRERGAADGIKGYLSEWFDVDRLILHTLGDAHDPALGIVIFHSMRPLGSRGARLNQEETDRFWGRQGSNPNTSSKPVLIPGEQQEAYRFSCKNCGEQQDVQTTSEKGVDTSITTYLLETAPNWSSACIVSKDVDFVPPVEALRRRGKRVFCAVESAVTPSALVRACQSSYAISAEFLAADYGLYELLIRDGGLDQIIAKLQQDSTLRLQVERRPRRVRDFDRHNRNLHVEICVTHSGDPSEVQRIKATVQPHLATVAMLSEWNEPNSHLLCINLRGPDLLFEGLDRHWHHGSRCGMAPRSSG